MPAELLFEIGCEEIPASFVGPALDHLSGRFAELAKEARLRHGRVRVFGTPRRLALLVEGVADRADDLSREVLGPPVRAAFDPAGAPTRAATKFAQGHGREVGELLRVTTPKGEYLAVRVDERGRPALELCAELLKATLTQLSFKKSMRWGDVDLSFARPVHWIVALLGSEVVPVVFGDVRSGRVTQGHRFLSQGDLELSAPGTYEATLERAHVIADVARRRAMVLERVQAAAAQAGGVLRPDDELIDQVTQLVELPSAVVGTFDVRHLELPGEVLVSEMRTHQRYFAVVDAAGRLLPKFVAVSNTPVKDAALSVRGYERVLRARLSDGRFFFDEDRRQRLETRVERLSRVVWQNRLGSYLEKVERFRALALWLARRTGHERWLRAVERGATLAKADLVTGMVGEFPELQGVMGREYARADGEPAEVCLAIFEHYLPRGASDLLPTGDPGALIGLADRLDSLCGIFGIGRTPTGAADPFGLRRACLALINVTLARGYRYRLSEAVDESLRLLDPWLKDVARKPTDPPVREQVLEFVRGRLKVLWSEKHRADVVEAVLSVGFDDLVATLRRLDALSALIAREDFQSLATVFRRVVNIVEKQGKDVAPGPVATELLTEPAERALFEAHAAVHERVSERARADDFDEALRIITGMKPAVDSFFEKVLVMAEDRALRDNRVRLLTQVGATFAQVADFARIQPEGSER